MTHAIKQEIFLGWDMNKYEYKILLYFYLNLKND